MEQYSVKLKLDVERESRKLIAERKFDSLDEAVKLVMEFIQEFGLADAGPQEIKIEIRSIP